MNHFLAAAMYAVLLWIQYRQSLQIADVRAKVLDVYDTLIAIGQHLQHMQDQDREPRRRHL